MQRPQMLLAAGVLLLAGLSGAWFAGRPPAPPPVVIDRDPGSSGDEPALITVHVAGAVERPGLVRVPEGARVGEALAAAGGASSAADLGSVNLAAPVGDGQQVVVPVRSSDGRESSETSDGRVHLNTADAADLEELPGVGPVLAGRIIAHREEHGPFEAVEDLLDVPGIGEGKLASLRDLVAVP
jgi:competence protein ComEA